MAQQDSIYKNALRLRRVGREKKIRVLQYGILFNIGWFPASLNVPNQALLTPLRIWHCKLVCHAALGTRWYWPVPLSGENLCSESWDSTGAVSLSASRVLNSRRGQRDFLYMTTSGRAGSGSCSKEWVHLPPGG